MEAVDLLVLERNFQIRVSDHCSKVYGINLSKIYQKTLLNEFIDFYGSKIKAVNSDVVATYFCSYLGGVLAGLQYMLSINKSINLALSNIEIQVYYDREYNYYGLTFKLLDPSILSWDPANREEWRNEQLSALYSEHIAPLLQTFVEETNVSLRDLWGQLSIGLYNGHDRAIEIAQLEEQKKKLELDFGFLTKELDSAIFKSKKNPLNITFRLIESASKPGVYERLKPTCCLYYKTEGAVRKCYSCPRMSDEDRDQWKQEIRSNSVV